MQSIDTFFSINYLAAESLSILSKKKPFFRKCEGQEKSSAGGPQIFFFFLISFWEIFSFLLYFLYNLCFYFILVFLACLFFSIKYIYSDTHLTVRAGDWKKFSRGRFPDTKLLYFLAYQRDILHVSKGRHVYKSYFRVANSTNTWLF